MNYIGSIPTQVWKIAKEISREESFPAEQPQDCPYIVLIHITDRQLLSLTGILKRQHIDLYLTDVYPPDAVKDFTPPDRITKDHAETLSWQLISKALSQFLHTSSIPNQTQKMSK